MSSFYLTRERAHATSTRVSRRPGRRRAMKLPEELGSALPREGRAQRELPLLWKGNPC